MIDLGWIQGTAGPKDPVHACAISGPSGSFDYGGAFS
jgi:hypothetical protein